MKDFILGSDEYIIRLQVNFAELHSTQIAPSPPGSTCLESPARVGAGNYSAGSGAMDENRAATDTSFFSHAITQQQQLHNQIAKDKQTK